jgi:iron complex transport system ATP-binding protein
MTPKTGRPRLEIQSLGVRYGRRLALSVTGFTAEAGELIAVVGPNGAGKSTLLKAIAGLHGPHRGHVRVDGAELTRLSVGARARRVAFLPQGLSAPPVRVAESLVLGRRPHVPAGFGWVTRPEDQTIIDRVVTTLDLAGFLERSADRLSGGELQRVLLARALIQQPRVLLLDEPINHLDPRHQLDVLGLIGDLTRAQGLLALVVLHDINHALRFADRLLMIAEGELIDDRPAVRVDGSVLTRLYGLTAQVVPTDLGRHVYFQRPPSRPSLP